MLDPALDGLGRVLAELGEVAAAVDGAAADLGGDPGELERVEERLFALRGLARKHQVAPEALPELAARAARPACAPSRTAPPGSAGSKRRSPRPRRRIGEAAAALSAPSGGRRRRGSTRGWRASSGR